MKSTVCAILCAMWLSGGVAESLWVSCLMTIREVMLLILAKLECQHLQDVLVGSEEERFYS